MRNATVVLLPCLLAADLILAAAGATPPSGQREAPPASGTKVDARATRPADSSRLIKMHVGIPGMAYIGQPLRELLQVFPKARVTPFARQEDAVVINAAEAGISCWAVGPTPEALRVASIGFNFEGTYGSVRAGGFRTVEGIGKGSSVAQLLAAYGTPVEISGERGTRPALHPPAPGKGDHEPKKYQYASDDARVKTYFMVQDDRVLRVVINDLAPLDRHIVKRPPQGSPSVSPPPPAVP